MESGEGGDEVFGRVPPSGRESKKKVEDGMGLTWEKEWNLILERCSIPEKVVQRIQRFLDDENEGELELSFLSSSKRAVLHRFAIELHMEHFSTGISSQRVFHLKKPSQDTESESEEEEIEKEKPHLEDETFPPLPFYSKRKISLPDKTIQFPLEIWYQIFIFMDAQTLCTSFQVCRAFSALANDNLMYLQVLF